MTRALNVYLTVDTEIWWSDPRLGAINDDFNRWFHGHTEDGDFGVPFQIDILERYGLTATYFVEALFGDAVGADYLKRMVEPIASRGQAVELHMHTEWLPHISEPVVEARIGDHIRCYDEDEQVRLLERGLENLSAAGIDGVTSFRAGNYGADHNTLRALKRVGLGLDSSYNVAYLGGACRIDADPLLYQPRQLDGVVVAPVGCISDYPGHIRHLQLTACSFGELKHALVTAHDRGWQDLVIVSHSFELLNAARTRPDPVVLKRYEKLCAFLASEPGKFVTKPFDPADMRTDTEAQTPLPGFLPNTGMRVMEQLRRRVLYS